MGLFSQKIYRKYYKFQNMLADVGGLIKGLIALAIIFNNFFSEKVFYNEIINENIHSLFVPGVELKHKDKMKEFENEKAKNECVQGAPSVKKGVKIEKKKIELPNLKNNGEKKKTTPPVKGIKDEFKHQPVPDSKTNENHHRTNDDQTLKLEFKSVNTEKMLISIKDPKDLKSKLVKNERQAENSIEKVDFNLFAYIFPKFCFGNKSRTRKHLELHYKFRSVIDHQMDVITILTKLNLVDKVNYILCGLRRRIFSKLL
jgi:hypothetical protein